MLPERKREIYEKVLFNDRDDNMLWNTGHALLFMLASNHVWGKEVWEIFKKDLEKINECAKYIEENEMVK